MGIGHDFAFNVCKASASQLAEKTAVDVFIGGRSTAFESRGKPASRDSFTTTHPMQEP